MTLMEKLKKWILHPFLFGAVPVLALLANNINQIGPMFAIRPLVIALMLAALFLFFYRLILKDWPRAALAATLSLLLIFTYGHVHPLLSRVSLAGINLGRNSYMAVFWVGLYAAGIWLIIKKYKSSSTWTATLNAVGLLMLGFSLGHITFYEVHSLISLRQSSAGVASLASQLHPQPGETLPDIYYIMPEDYERSDALKTIFGYDNSPFLASLEQMGFYIATCSQANYNTSDASLAASLNMQYLATLNNQFTPPNTDLGDLSPYLQNSAVLQTLKTLGYKFIAFQSGYSPTEFRNADIYLSPQTDLNNLQLFGGLSPLEALLFQTTIGDFFLETHILPNSVSNTIFDNAYLLDRNRILYELQKLPEVSSLPGPKFVWVHLLAPHNPFVFGPQGEFLHRNTPFTYNDDQDAVHFDDYRSGYDGEINYLDNRLLEGIKAILDHSARPPIILLQSDDGSTRAGVWSLATLNAYYLPPGSEQNLYPTISPVNSFRVIFNSYFGGHLDLLKDQGCDSPRKNPYHCAAVVDPNPQCSAAIKP